jgi:hypothetical protein
MASNHPKRTNPKEYNSDSDTGTVIHRQMEEDQLYEDVGPSVSQAENRVGQDTTSTSSESRDECKDVPPDLSKKKGKPPMAPGSDKPKKSPKKAFTEYRNKPPVITSSDTPSDQDFIWDDEAYKQKKREERKKAREQRRRDEKLSSFSFATFFKKNKQGGYQGLDQVDSKSADESNVSSGSHVDVTKLSFLPDGLKEFIMEVQQTEHNDEGFSKKLKKLNSLLKATVKEQLILSAHRSITAAMANATTDKDLFKDQIAMFDKTIEDGQKEAIRAIKEIQEIRKGMVKSKPVLTMPKIKEREPTKQFLWQDYYNIRDMSNDKDHSRHLKINWNILKTFGEQANFTEDHYKSAFYYMLTSEMKDHYMEENLGDLKLKDILKKMSDHYISAKSLPAKREYAETCRREAGEELRTAARRYERCLNEISYSMPAANVPGWKHEKMKQFILKNTLKSVKIALARKEADALENNTHVSIEEYLKIANHEESIWVGYEKFQPEMTNQTLQAPVFHTELTSIDEVDGEDLEQMEAYPAFQKKPDLHKKKPYGRQNDKRDQKEFSKPKAQNIMNQVARDPQQSTWSPPKQQQYPKKNDASNKEMNDLRKQLYREQQKNQRYEQQNQGQGGPGPRQGQRHQGQPQHQPNHGPPNNGYQSNQGQGGQERYKKKKFQSNPYGNQGYDGQGYQGQHRGPPRQQQGGYYQGPPRQPQGYQQGYQNAPQWKKKRGRRGQQQYSGSYAPDGSYVLHPKAPAAVVQGDNYQSFFQQRKGQGNWYTPQNTYMTGTHYQDAQYQYHPSGMPIQQPMHHGSPGPYPMIPGSSMYQGSPGPYLMPPGSPVHSGPQGPTMQANMVTFQTPPRKVPQPTYATVANGQGMMPPPCQEKGAVPKPMEGLQLEVDYMLRKEAYFLPGRELSQIAQSIYADATSKLEHAKSLVSMLRNNCARFKGLLMETYPNETFGEIPHLYLATTFAPGVRPNVLVILAPVGMGPARKILWRGTSYTPVFTGPQRTEQKRFTDMMRGEDRSYEVIQMTETGAIQCLPENDKNFFDIINAKDFHNDHPQLYASTKNLPFRYVWLKERNQVLLKNRPDQFGDSIQKEDVVLERAEQPQEQAAKKQRPQKQKAKRDDQQVQKPSTTEPAKAVKAMVGSQNVILKNLEAEMKLLQQIYFVQQFKLPFDWPEGKPLYKQVYYEQDGKRNPKIQDYLVLKADITRPLPRRYIKSIGKNFKPVADRNRFNRYKKDYEEKMQETSQREQPSLNLQQMLLWEELAREQGKTLSKDTVDPQDITDPEPKEGQVKKKLKQSKNNGQKGTTGPPQKRGPGRPPKQAQDEHMEITDMITAAPCFMSNTVPFGFDTINTQFSRHHLFHKGRGKQGKT